MLLLIATFFSLLATSSFGHTFHGAALAPDGQNGWVVASDTTVILHTSNSGANWTRQTIPDMRLLFDVFFLNGQKGWILADQGFIFYTSNGGNTWIRQFAGLAKRVGRIFFFDDTCGWAACKEVIGRTVRGNDTVWHWETWQQICPPCPPFSSETTWFNGISFSNILKGWVCAGRFPEYWWPPGETVYTRGQGYIAVSNDSGLTWQLQKRDTINDFFDIKFLDTLNGFIVGGNDRTMSATVMKTQNGGVTWQTVTIPAQAKFLQGIEVINNNYIWAVGHNGTIIHSRNGGQTWIIQQSNVNTTLYDVDFADTLHGLVAGDSYVQYTHDGGNTWHIANLGVEEERTTFDAIGNMLEVYPNPAKAFFTLRLPQSADREQIKIFDVTGKVVKELESSGKKELRISLKGIKPGVYFVRIGNEMVKEKLVVTR